ncbi:transposase [Escherichia coli]|nr:transposase [Escherichia coli]
MISLPSGTRIWLVAGVTDMRKSFNGLGEQVQHVLDENPFSGHLFIFRGRRGDTIKILWADADGLCLLSPNVWRKASLSGLRCVTVRYPLPARSWQCSSINWTGVSPKHPALMH